MVKRLMVACVLLGSVVAVAQTDDNFILEVMPPILGAIQYRAPPPPPPPPPVLNPQWGAFTKVCCPSSLDTYRVRQGDQSRVSYSTDCDTPGTFEGYLTTTPGSKGFGYEVISPACGNAYGSTTFSLQTDTQYLFQLEVIDNQLTTVIYESSLVSTSKTLSNNSLSENAGLERVGQFILEQRPKGRSRFQSVKYPNPM